MNALLNRRLGIQVGDQASAWNWKIFLCFACVYLFWGGTFLAIKVAITAIPPMLLSGGRFFIAGLILLGLGRLRREPWLDAGLARSALMSGGLLVFANGLVCYSEQWLSSGAAAVSVGSVPVWIMLINWLGFDRSRPSLRQVVGIGIAITGIFLLTRSQSEGGGQNGPLGMAIVLAAVLCWSFGTLIQRKVGKLTNVFTFSGVQLATGGALVGLIGNWVSPGVIMVEGLTWQILAACAYLVFCGSVITFSAYLWLCAQVTNPAKVSTYAVVNPMVAVWLGWWLADEQVSASMIVLSALVLAGLSLVIFEVKWPWRARWVEKARA